MSTHFGSTRSTLALLGLMAAVVLVRPAWWPLALVISLLSLNLLVAVVLHPAFRRQLPLLVAHLALLALAVLVAVGRLTALDGRFELTQGEPFDGSLLDREAGALHVDRLQRLSFRHEGFEIDYAPGRQRGATRNTVAWQDEQGRPQRGVIGDHRPLVLDGHRFYTSSNKGFAPLLRWEPAAGEPLRGAVHLPSYPMHELRQSRAWALPDGREAWVMLQIDETLIAPDAAAQFRLPRQYRLVVRVGEARAELLPGQALALPGGRLVFEEMRTWMGYRVAYDPALPWLLAASLLAALALAAHYLQRFWPHTRAAAAAPLRTGLADG
ncbi:cytochrome c biogenesis protein ResB [Rubrivivax sp. A210]|uniref:cytochrome c biogenesis protein ResB n=1 Tax=Rubrivivax sp. A210 TaxID=2772301 RepID=UPI001917F615|nr:cytochrome c biogenesis protein ResB [Rubrivivax sp. A210]